MIVFRTEKNASNWSKDKLKQLLTGLVIDEPGVGLCRITSVDTIEGEAVANNRKGKLIFFYEWVLKCTWTGNLNGSEDEVKGSIDIPNLSEENSADEVDVEVSIDSNDFNSEILKGVMRNKGTTVIREQLQKYILSLRDDFAKDMIKPSKLVSGGNINAFQTESQLKAKKDENSSQQKFNGYVDKPKDKSNDKLEFTSLKMTEEFKCTAEEVYRSLTEVDFLQAFTRTRAVFEGTAGGRFELFDGNICGKNTVLVPNKQIKQEWRFKAWPPNHYSEVTIDFEQKTDCTDVTVTQTGIPKNDFDRTENGWKHYYFESLKRTFGFGVSLH